MRYETQDTRHKTQSLSRCKWENQETRGVVELGIHSGNLCVPLRLFCVLCGQTFDANLGQSHDFYVWDYPILGAKLPFGTEGVYFQKTIYVRYADYVVKTYL